MMGICPNCGSWVDEGDICGFCGGSGSYTPDNDNDNSLDVRIGATQKIRQARRIFYEATRDKNVDLQKAINLLNETIKEIDECLEDDNVSEYFSLRDLRRDSIELKREIENKLTEITHDKEYDRIIRRKGKDKLIPIKKFYKDFNTENLVFKLVKESNMIKVYFEERYIGEVYATLGRDLDELFSTVKDLQHLPKISYAEYFCKYPGRYNYPIKGGGGITIAELIEADSTIEQEETNDEEVDVNVNEENPDDFQYWYDIAVALVHLRKFDKAIECIDKSMKLNPDLYLLWYTKGKILTEINRYEESIEYLDKAFELNPSYTLSLNTKGIALSHLKQFDKAKACFEEAILLNPKDDYALKLMGNLNLIGLKDYPNAIKYFKKSIKLDSKDSMLWNNLADAYLNAKEFEKGLECCHKAIYFNPENFRAFITTGEIYYELEQYDKAMYYADEAKEINPTNSDLLNLIKKVKEAQSAARTSSINKILRY